MYMLLKIGKPIFQVSNFVLTFTTLKYFYVNDGDQMFFFQFEIIINVLVRYFRASFEYPRYVSRAIINTLILSGRGPSLDIRSSPRS